jgi:hypothetical protein
MFEAFFVALAFLAVVSAFLVVKLVCVASVF